MTVVRFIDNLVAGNLPGRSRVINGAFLFDQRDSAGSPVVATNIGAYGPDRMIAFESVTGGSFDIRRSSASPPDGFKYFMRATVIDAATAGVAESAWVGKRIEGNNLIDIGFGKSWAEKIADSFYVRSSLTGTYCLALSNNSSNRHFISEYTLVANVWKRIELPIITADTVTPWLDNNGIGLRLVWDLGSGSNFDDTPNVWAAGNKSRTTNQADWIGTAAATFDITGVQFERGIHTPFDWRLYPAEFVHCQRYMQKSYRQGIAPGTVTSLGAEELHAKSVNDPYNFYPVNLHVSMRSSPTVLLYSVANADTTGVVSLNDVTDKACEIRTTSNAFFNLRSGGGNLAIGGRHVFHWTAISEL